MPRAGGRRTPSPPGWGHFPLDSGPKPFDGVLGRRTSRQRCDARRGEDWQGAPPRRAPAVGRIPALDALERRPQPHAEDGARVREEAGWARLDPPGQGREDWGTGASARCTPRVPVTAGCLHYNRSAPAVNASRGLGLRSNAGPSRASSRSGYDTREPARAGSPSLGSLRSPLRSVRSTPGRADPRVGSHERNGPKTVAAPPQGTGSRSSEGDVPRGRRSTPLHEH